MRGVRGNACKRNSGFTGCVDKAAMRRRALRTLGRGNTEEGWEGGHCGESVHGGDLDFLVVRIYEVVEAEVSPIEWAYFTGLVP